jgi:hypothetical protein
VAAGDEDETLDALVLAPTQTARADTPSPGDRMLHAGDTVARYRIDGFLGRGGMGVVYRATGNAGRVVWRDPGRGNGR